MPHAKPLLILVIAPLFLFGTLDRIQKALAKSDFEKAGELIMKGYEKEPDNPGIYYLHALLLFNTSYPNYDPDSARLTVSRAATLFELASSEVKEELIQERITNRSIDSLRLQIRDYFFKKTIQDISKKKINAFLSRYPKTVYRDILIYKRDSLDYLEAKNIGTQRSYIKFMREHSPSVFTLEADSILDFLRYDSMQQRGILKDYISFRSTYPTSRYIGDVEEYILKVSTASHLVRDFEKFIKKAKTEKWKQRAKDLLFFFEEHNENIQSDSLQKIRQLQEKILFPTANDGRFGFVNDDGVVQIKAQYGAIHSRDKCGAITDNWIFVSNGDEGRVILRDGTTLIRGVEDYEFISKSTGLLKINAQWFVYHKSGYRVIEAPVDDVEVFDNQWVKIYQNGKWGLFTLLGIPIAETKYDEIYRLGDFWVFERNEQLAVYTDGEILKEIEDRGLSLEFKFDDLELVNEEILIGFKDGKECLLDQNLEFLIPWGDYEIFPDPSGWYLRFERGYALYNNNDIRILKRDYPYLESNEGWLALQTEQDWILVPRNSQLGPSRSYDSIRLISPYAALLFKNEDRKLLFHQGKELTLSTHVVKSFTNRPEFIEITNEGAIGVYDKAGESVLEGIYDEVTFLTDTILKVSKEEKVGLVSIGGSFVLNPIFDSIDEKDGLVLTLYDGKIGCYDLHNKVLISPEYEARVASIGAHYYTKKEGFYGLVDANEEEVLPFIYDEITYWNDTSFLVKAQDSYEIINASQEQLTDPFSKLQLLYEDGVERIFKYVQNGKFGLRSDQKGDLLAPEFTDILNIGTENQAVFFADQHLSRAGYHVVSYLDQSGNLIFSNAYRKEIFENIICDD